MATNRTHAVGCRSVVEAATATDADFPLQNLPLGVFRRGGEGASRIGVAIGDRVLDLSAARAAGLLDGLDAVVAAAIEAPVLNPLMALGDAAASTLRARVFDLLDADGPARDALAGRTDRVLVPMAEAEMRLPTEVGDFTDFLTSGYHSTRLSPKKALALNFMSMPIAYHSRASSVRVSGGTIVRPLVQARDGEAVRFGPTGQLDYELEVGAFVGPGNALGEPVALDDAAGRLFGYCLLNDWSVRDTQIWEMPPLGPFLAKSLSTSISPWVVTAEAMAPFRAPAFARGEGEPAPLPHLFSTRDQAEGGFDLRLEALLLTPRMRAAGAAPVAVTRTNFRHMYWTFAQMAAHHMSNGCNLRPGDLLGSGTTSGPTDASRACLAELTERGTNALALPGGETRVWLEDGDEVIFRARAEREGFASIGFGECRGTIAPAPAWPSR